MQIFWALQFSEYALIKRNNLTPRVVLGEAAAHRESGLASCVEGYGGK